MNPPWWEVIEGRERFDVFTADGDVYPATITSARPPRLRATTAARYSCGPMESRGTVIILVLLGGVALAAVGIGVMTAKPQIAIILLALVTVAIVVVLVRRLRRSRLFGPDAKQAQSTMAALGLMPIPKPGKDLLKHFADLGVIHRSGSIKHAMHGMLGERRLMIFQHTYHVHTGQANIPIVNTLFATTSPRWPEMRITHRGFWSHVALKFGYGRGVQVESGAFNRAFKVSCADEDFAITLLSPDLQAFLLEADGERWTLSGGEVCLLQRSALRFDRLGPATERLKRFWSLVPRELEAWDGA